MLKKIVQRLAFGRNDWDPVAYWRSRADDPSTQSVMWNNLTYNDLVDRAEWRVIERHLPPGRGASLDLGCGTGRMSARLSARFDSYLGVDLDTMVAEAERRNPALAGRFVASTVEDYDYPEAQFDFILSLGVLATACTETSLPAVVERIWRALKPGGRLVLIEPFHRNRLLTRGCKSTTREVATTFEHLGAHVEEISAMLFIPARFLLGEPVMGRYPALTKQLFRAGERIASLRPAWFGDYGILVLTRG